MRADHFGYKVGTRVQTRARRPWTGTIIRVLDLSFGNGAVEVEWDHAPVLRRQEQAIISNPPLNLEIIEELA